MEKKNPAGTKNSGSELGGLLEQIKAATGKSFLQIGLDCGYETRNYLSQVLNREKNGIAVPPSIIGKVRSRFTKALNDKVVIEILEEDVIKDLLQDIVGLRTQVAILTTQLAKMRADYYRSDFENEHAALRAQMIDGVGSNARTVRP